MNFNSQICTTKEQSKRLIALGLKKEMADMAYEYKPKYLADTDIDKDWVIVAHSPCGTDIPAWSLHRLIEMMPYDFTNNNNTYELHVTCDGAGYDDKEDMYSIVGWWRSNTYNDIIDCIEWLIKEGHFNKEYLEE